MKNIQFEATLVMIVLVFWTSSALPLLGEFQDGGLSEQSFNKSAARNDTPKELYVVRAVVYEIGILTDASEEDNSTSTETRERVDLTFFDAHSNSSHIDLGQIPLPIQTNISGQVLTGIAPVNIGAFSNPSELLESLPLTGTIVNITHSDTALFRLTSHNLTEDEGPQLLNSEDLAMFPQIADILPDIEQNSNSEDQARRIRAFKIFNRL